MLHLTSGYCHLSGTAGSFCQLYSCLLMGKLARSGHYTIKLCSENILASTMPTAEYQAVGAFIHPVPDCHLYQKAKPAGLHNRLWTYGGVFKASVGVSPDHKTSRATSLSKVNISDIPCLKHNHTNQNCASSPSPRSIHSANDPAPNSRDGQNPPSLQKPQCPSALRLKRSKRTST